MSDATPDSFETIDEIAERARRQLSPSVWDYLAGGAGEEQTLAANELAFRKWSIRPRLMSGIGAVKLDTTFMGMTLRMPVATAPFGTEGQFHPLGYIAVARANAAAGVASIVPEASPFSLEEVAAAAPDAPRLMQLHPLGKAENVLALIERARLAGFSGLCVTCDCPTVGWRERNRRNRFTINARQMEGNYPADGPIDPEGIFGQLEVIESPIWTWLELAEVMTAGGLPWMAKGILTADDAEAAAAAGARAVAVSNHGGRQLDGAPASLSQLPEVREALKGTGIEIAIDGGVRRGSDIVKALALGADLVIIGRLAALGLAASGEAGVARLHALLRDEITTILRLAGRADVGDLDLSLLQPA